MSPIILLTSDNIFSSVKYINQLVHILFVTIANKSIYNVEQLSKRILKCTFTGLSSFSFLKKKMKRIFLVDLFTRNITKFHVSSHV